MPTNAANPDAQRPSIAVVGSGIAGLTTAWLLRDRFDVTLFETQARPGMGAFSVEVPGPDGQPATVDVPTRVFCSGYYPQMEALFRHIGVEMEQTDHAGAFSDANGRLILHYANLSVSGRQLSYLPWRGLRSGRSRRLGWAATRFFRMAEQDMREPDAWADQTLAEYLQAREVSPEFVELVLLPALCVICTCSPDEARAYPSDLLLTYLTSGVMKTGVMRSAHGVADVVARLTQGVHLLSDTTVTRVEPDADGVNVVIDRGDTARFDQVVLAVQAQQAAAMLPDAAPARALLQQVPWAASDMTVHCNPAAALVPGAPVNYRVGGQATPEVTVDMARSFPSFRRLGALYQTWNPWDDQADAVARFSFTRPVVTLDSRAAMRRLRALQSESRLWYCGAYVADRVPLLEAAVCSALDVAEGLGVRAPWQ